MSDYTDRVQRAIRIATYRETTGRRLHAVVGHLRRELGFCSFDAGDHSLAEQHFNAALVEATIGADAPLKVWVMHGMAQQACEAGSGRRALMLVDGAKAEVRSFGSDRLLAKLVSLEGRAHALTGDARAADLAYARAESLLTPYDPDRDPNWLDGWWSPADFDAGRAAAGLALGAPDVAVAAAERALATVDRASYPRNAASYASFLALAHFQAGELDAAAAMSAGALDMLDGVKSNRVVNRLRPMRPAFEAIAHNEHAARALEAFRAL